MSQFRPASVLILFVVLALSATNGEAQQIKREAYFSREPASLPRTYTAVVGSVALPGVYEYTSGTATLRDLIRDANGLTEEASGTFRIVRAGNVSNQMFYNPGGKMSLLSGDILIFDKSPAGGRLNQETYHSGSSAAAQTQHLVQIAVVNLLRRPVVLQVRPQHATLNRLVSLLNQNREIIPGMKIYLAESARFIRQGNQWANSLLPSGSVLFFDPYTVQVDRIPPLPIVYKPKGIGGTPKPIIHSISTPPSGYNSAGVIKLISGSSSRNESDRIKSAEIPLWVPPPSEMDTARPVNSLSAETIFQGDNTGMKTASLTKGMPPVAPPAPSEIAPLASLTDERKKTAATDLTTEIAEESGIFLPFGKSAVWGWSIFGCLALLIAGWFLKRKIKPAVQPQFEFQPVQQKSDGILDALIENKLPLIEEPFPIPQVLELRTRPVPQRTFRLDAAHPVGKNYFPPAVSVDNPVPSETERETTKIETTETPFDPTLIPTMEHFTAFASPSILSEVTWETEFEAERISENANQPEPTSADQTHRVDRPPERSLNLHSRRPQGVLDRVLVTLHGATWQ